MPLSDRCPNTGDKCFLTTWYCASRAGLGELEPDYIDTVMEQALGNPEVSQYLSCGEIVIEDDGPKEPTCSALSLITGLIAREIFEAYGEIGLTRDAVAEATTRITGVTIAS